MNEYRKLVNLYHTQQTYNLYILLPEMIQHKCIQEDNIKELRKDVQVSKERDILQTANLKEMQKQLNRVEKNTESITNKLDTFIEKADNKYAQKSDVEKLNKIVWSVIAFVFAALGTALLAILVRSDIKVYSEQNQSANTIKESNVSYFPRLWAYCKTI